MNRAIAIIAMTMLAGSGATAGAPATPDGGATAPVGTAAETGALTVVARAGPTDFTPAALEGLGLHRVETTSFWPDDGGVYEGPLLSQLLASLGAAQSPSIRVVAEDGYVGVIPQEDWARWPVIVATRRNGVPMTLKERGPLRIIYPRDADSTLVQPLYRPRWVWMVKRLEVVE